MADIPVRLHTDKIDLARDSVPAAAAQTVPCKGWLIVRNTSRQPRTIGLVAAGQPATLTIPRRPRREKHIDMMITLPEGQPVTYSNPAGLTVLVVTLPEWLHPCLG